MRADNPFDDFANARRSIYLTSAQINCTLNVFLDLMDPEFRARIKQKINSSFDHQVRAFSGVRDAIVLSTFRDTFATPELVDQYIGRLEAEEPDEDLRALRAGIFKAVASVH